MNKISIIPSDNNNLPAEIERNISTINEPLGNFLVHIGLPVQDILSPIDERRKVIQSLHAVLEILPLEQRSKARYLTKFTLNVAMGLFDGALAFLWDETIDAMRKKIIDFDLAYFYSIAESMSSRYRGLSDALEITAVSEFDLLEISRRIGLIDDINHRRLETVNYFRNHASSAHPNENTVSGIELLSHLENCLKYAICAPVEHSAIQVKRFLDNIRQYVIPVSDFDHILLEIEKLPKQRIEDVLQALFGMYVDPRIEQKVIDNINGVAPRIWSYVSNELKIRVGSKFGYYRANGDVARRNRVQELLTIVDGNVFKDEDSLGAELVEKLQHLRTAHYSSNNFYNEFPHAKSIDQSLPASGIPKSAQHEFVKVISICAIGNGLGYKKGVDENALLYYIEFIKRFNDEEIAIFVKLFSDYEFVKDLHLEKAKTRAVSLATHLKEKATSVLLKNALDVVIAAPAIEKIHNSSDYRRAVQQVS